MYEKTIMYPVKSFENYPVGSYHDNDKDSRIFRVIRHNEVGMYVILEEVKE